MKLNRESAAICLIGSLAVVVLTVVCYRLHFNLATASLLYVIVIVLLAHTGNLVSSIIVSIIAALCLAYLAPPADTFRVDNPLDIVAIIAFLSTSLVIARLVSKLQKAKEEALSSVNRRLVESEEKERNRIARDLHDDICQRLALVVNDLGVLKQNSSGCPAEVRGGLAELHTDTSEIASDVQALAHELHSSHLELLGIETAMKGFCKEFGLRRKCEIDFTSHFQNPPPKDISGSLVRVLQEALHNAVKHSGVKHFEVRLWEAQAGIHLTVRDFGLGFDPEAAVRGKGLGLTSMREQMKLVNGTFSIDSQAHGTTVHASVPLPPGRSA
jgi:signal transduction histidine kinase